jgi:uncharacterized membrane protein YoaK (UPF0700 family)
VLALIAGMSDVIGFLTFKIFTAHITGNLVVIAVLLVRGGPPNLAQVLTVPIFIVAVAALWAIARTSRIQGRPLARVYLLLQFLLFICVLIISVRYNPAANLHGVAAIVTPLLAVSAISCQFALLRITIPGAPSTAAMTGNTTNVILSFLDSISRGEPLAKEARARFKRTVAALAGFFVGCLAGAFAYSWLGDWAWSFPLVVAAFAVVLG